MNDRLAAFGQTRLAVALWALALFACCYAVNCRHNDFPFFYHPDEPGKVEQLIERKWNFHHPMLLLRTVQLTAGKDAVPGREQAVVETGRHVSAALMAIAVVALSLLALLWRGWPAALAAGVALGTHHQLYELAHYLKEDSALLAGMSLAFLASLAYWQAPSILRGALLGGACALAISGKYVGVAVLAIALPILVRAPFPRRRLAWGAAAGALLAVMVIVNWPLLTDLDTFRASFSREVQLVATGQGEVTRRVPHALYWNVFVDNTSPIIWLLLAGFLVARWHHRRSMALPDRLLVLFPFVYALALSFSPKENDRYFLPATALLTLFAAMGVQDFPRLLSLLADGFGWSHPERWLEQRARGGVIAGAALLLFTIQLTGWWRSKPGLLQYDAAFQVDDQAELLAWLQQEVPPTAVIAADSRAGVPDPKRKKNAARVAAIPQKLLVSKLASDLGTLDELRAKGVTHVIVSETSYGRFFRGGLRPKDGKDAKFERGAAFYEQLFQEGTRVFEKDRGTVIYLHPGIVAYQIAKPAAAPVNSSGPLLP